MDELSIETTVHIAPATQGNGIAPDAVTTLANHYEACLGARQVTAKIHHTNERSQKMVRKLGLQETDVWDDKGHETWSATLPLPPWPRS